MGSNLLELDRELRELVCSALHPQPKQDVTIVYFIQQGREPVHLPVEPAQRVGPLHQQQVESDLLELDRELPDPIHVACTLVPMACELMNGGYPARDYSNRAWLYHHYEYIKGNDFTTYRCGAAD